MTDEEKKAIDKLKRSANYFVMPIYETKIILELIEKQSKEIEEYKKQLDLDYVDNNFISKAKIKAKIEIRKEEKENCKDSIEEKYLLREIYVLQSLLEKE